MSRLALVTGASSGIGREFAVQLAERGWDPVLVARDVARLEALASELRGRRGADVEVLPADLTLPLQLESVARRLRAAPAVDLLVNNAGMGVIGSFRVADAERLKAQLELNMVAPVVLARAVLPGMVERGRGGVINVSSLAAFQPGPWHTSYAASKAFLNYFTEGLHEELRGTGVRVQALCPGYTRTEFQERAGAPARRVPRMLWQQPGPVVRASLKGLDRGSLIVIPGTLNRTMWFASKLAPGPLVRRLSGMFAKA